jgi:mannosyltransferase
MSGGVVSTPAGESAAAERASTLSRLAPSVAVAAALGALVAYGVVAARRSLGVDEAVSVRAASEPLGDALEHALSHDPGQVVHRALVHAVAAVDRAEWWLRAPSFLATLFAVACVTWLAWMLGSRRAGVIAGAIFATGAGVAEVSQLAQPYALALAAISLSTCLFVRAMTTGSLVTWIFYGLISAMLPLAHPGAAAVLVAQGAALVVARSRVPRARVAPVALFVTVVAGFLVAAAVVDRYDASGDGDASLGSLASGLMRAAAWSPLVAGLACWGVVALVRRHRSEEPPWRAVLVGGLAAAPLVALLVAGTGLAVFPRHALVLCAPGIAVAAGVGLAAVADDGMFVLLASATALVAALQLGATTLTPAAEDWRGAARFVREHRGPRETVVVIPRRGEAALRYYSPYQQVHGAARGDGAWLFLQASSADASRLARTAVTTPRYALLAGREYGDGLTVEHWVRP